MSFLGQFKRHFKVSTILNNWFNILFPHLGQLCVQFWMAFLFMAQAVARVLVAVVAVPKRQKSVSVECQDHLLPASERLEIQVHIHMEFQWCWR